MPRGIRKAPAGKQGEWMKEIKLCALTGLSGAQLRRISRLGYYPAPLKGFYRLAQTLPGLFRYYREQEQRIRGTREQVSREKLRRLKFENDAREGKYWLAEQVQDAVKKLGGRVSIILRQRLVAELPLKLEGLRSEEMLPLLKHAHDEIVREMRALHL